MKTKNKKCLNAKHRFTPREDPSTLPIHKISPPNNTTDTQDTQPIYEVHSSNWTKPEKYSQNDTAIPQQPKIIHTLKRTYTHSPSSNHPSCKKKVLLSKAHTARHESHIRISASTQKAPLTTKSIPAVIYRTPLTLYRYYILNHNF